MLVDITDDHELTTNQNCVSRNGSASSCCELELLGEWLTLT